MTGLRRLVLIGTTTAGSAISAWLVGQAVAGIADDRNAPWMLGRATGVTAYLLLVVLVATGLVLSHPRRELWRRPNATTRIRLHVSLTVFALVVTVAHIVVLATDHYAGVGWWGALVPMRSDYRPMPMTLGVVGVYAGLLAGVTAAFAGRWAARVWWPVHKVAATVVALIVGHAVLAGSDTGALLPLYLGTGAALLLLSGWRYLAARPDRAGPATGAISGTVAEPVSRRAAAGRPR